MARSTSRYWITALCAAVVASLFVLITAPAGHAAGQSCPDFGKAKVVGELSRDSIREASGLVASPNYTGKFWLHNDSGDSARIYAMTGTGEDRGIVNLGGITAKDFEDIGMGPGPNVGKDYIYVADIGNNGHGRSTVWIYRFVEPAPPGKGKSITIPNHKIEKFEYTYQKPGEPGKTWRRQAESLFVDPISQDVVIIEKQLQTIDGKRDMGWVYRISQSSLQEGVLIKAKPKVAIRQRRSNSEGPMTAADISPDGRIIIAKNVHEAFAWKRPSGQSVYEALAAYPVTSCHPPGTSGEAVAFTKDGGAVLTVHERRNSPVSRYSVNGGGGQEPPPPPNGPECGGRAATIVGTNGDDVLIGTSGVDVIVGRDGNDVIRGLEGRDFICGGPGDDVLYGNEGRDEIHGYDGDDLIKGGLNDDFIVGAQGNDVLYGNDGDDYLAGAVGNDKLFGGDGNDELVAGADTDFCKGGPGNDDYSGCE